MPLRLSLLAALGLALAALSAPQSAAAQACKIPDGPKAKATVARIGKKAVKLSELDARIADELCKARTELAKKQAELRQQALDQLIAERLLKAEAKARKLDGVEALIKAEVIDGTPAPSDAQVQAFFAANQDQMQGATLEQIGPRIRGHLHDQARQATFDALVEGLRVKGKVTVSLEPYRVQVEAKGPSRGPQDAVVTIVEFSDYECPFCAKAAASVEEARALFPDHVRVVMRDFPLDFHPNAVPAAIAARCAGAQGKYYEMHDKLFANQKQLDPATFKAHAQALGLDLGAFDACFADPQQLAAVAADHKAGAAVGVEGTPAFFVNGVPLGGAQPTSKFIELIEAELRRKGIDPTKARKGG